MIVQMNNKEATITQNRCSGRKYYGKLDVIRGRIAYRRIRWYLQKSSFWDLHYKSSKEQTFKGSKKVSTHIPGWICSISQQKEHRRRPPAMGATLVIQLKENVCRPSAIRSMFSPQTHATLLRSVVFGGQLSHEGRILIDQTNDLLQGTSEYKVPLKRIQGVTGCLQLGRGSP